MENNKKIGETGHSRIVRDKVAEVYELIQNWNNQVKAGQVIIGLINKSDLSKGSNINMNLYELCEKLGSNVYQMETIIFKMEAIENNLAAVTKLCNSNANLSRTWTAEKFEKTTKEIVQSYKQELEVKRKIAECIAHQENSIQGTALEAAWIYESKISPTINLTLEAMLLEIGLKNVKK